MQTSELFQQYKKDFIDNINKLQAMTLGDQVSPKGLDSYEKLVKNTKLLQKHISVELCSLGSKKSKQINQELKPFKDKFRILQKKLEILIAQRTEQTPNAQSSDDIRLHTRQTVKQLQENDRLGECKKLLYEMEDISGEVSNNLKAQSEKMEKSKGKLLDTGKLISKANSLIDIMITRERRRQSVVCITLVGAVLLGFGLKYLY